MSVIFTMILCCFVPCDLFHKGAFPNAFLLKNMLLFVQFYLSLGLSRELTNVGSEDVQALISLGNWVIVLALHILSAKPEFKTRRGPGFWILQDGGLEVIREIVIMVRL